MDTNAPQVDTASTSTDTTTTTTTEAPATTTQAADTTTTTTTADTTATTTDTTAAEYKIPDAYKDKPWAAKVKSEDDLWKQLENTQTLLGKKHVVPDFEKATPKEIEDFLAQTRPADEKAYDFSGGEEGYTPSDLDPQFAKAFQKAGIHPKIGNELIKDLKGAIETAADAAFEPDTFISAMKTSLGSEAKINETRQLIESHVSAEDKAALDEIPNQHLGVLYRLAANLQKAYGASETGIGGEHNAGGGGKPIAEVQADLRKQIRELDKRPHEASEKEALIKRLNDTYKTTTNKR